MALAGTTALSPTLMPSATTVMPHSSGSPSAAGGVPTCVKHCQAKCLEYGPLDELAGKLGAKAKQALVALG